MPKKLSSGPLAKISPTKSLKSKRIAKAFEKTSGAKLVKRAYKKRDVQGAPVADESKSTNQGITANAMQKENRSNTKNELAPPFTASAATKSTPADSDDSPEPVDTYRQKFLRYLKKKYSVKTKRHIYKARQQVAERRLRIEGRFVTKKQAYEILGMDEGSL